MIRFGDNTDWDKFSDEMFSMGEITGDGTDRFDDCRELIKTDTDTKERRALDCGCNIGKWYNIVRNYGFKYTGVDSCNKAIFMAREANPNVDFLCSPLWDLNFSEDFDLVFTNSVLQHNILVDQEKIIEKIYKALKPGGIFRMEEGTEPITTDTQRTKQGWIDMVESHGFKFIKSSKGTYPNTNGIDTRYIFRKEK